MSADHPPRTGQPAPRLDGVRAARPHAVRVHAEHAPEADAGAGAVGRAGRHLVRAGKTRWPNGVVSSRTATQEQIVALIRQQRLRSLPIDMKYHVEVERVAGAVQHLFSNSMPEVDRCIHALLMRDKDEGTLRRIDVTRHVRRIVVRVDEERA